MPRKMQNEKTMPETSQAVSKREFMKNLPEGISMGDLMARAKSSGVKISKSYAYTLLADRKKSGKKARRPGARARRTRKTMSNGAQRALVAAPPAVARPVASKPEAQFVSLAVDLGLRKSQELLDRLRTRLRTLVD
jgi:hypothetical protein